MIKLTISDEELVCATGDFGGFSSLLVGLVGLLEVDEDVGGACSLDPILQNVFVLGVRKGLLKKRALVDVTRFDSNS